MRFTHTVETDHFGELDLIVDYDYEPAEPETRLEPGCAENAVINAVMINLAGNYATMPTAEFLDELLVEAALEDFHANKMDAVEQAADQKYQQMKDERI